VWLISAVAPDVFFRHFDIFNSIFFAFDIVALACILVVTRKTLAEGVRDKQGMAFKFKKRKKKNLEKHTSGTGFSFWRFKLGGSSKHLRKNLLVGKQKGSLVSAAPECSDTVTSGATGASASSKRGSASSNRGSASSKRGSATSTEHSGDMLSPTLKSPTSLTRRISLNLAGKTSQRLSKAHRHKHSRRASESMRVENLHLQPILNGMGSTIATGSLTIDFDVDTKGPKKKRRLLANYAKLVNEWKPRSKRSYIADPDNAVVVVGGGGHRGSVSVLGASPLKFKSVTTSPDSEASHLSAQSAVDNDSDTDGMDEITTSNIGGDIVDDRSRLTAGFENTLLLARRELSRILSDDGLLSREMSGQRGSTSVSMSTEIIEIVSRANNGQRSRTKSRESRSASRQRSPRGASKGSFDESRSASNTDEPVCSLTKTPNTPDALSMTTTTTMRTMEMRERLIGIDDLSLAIREARQRVGGGDNNFSSETGNGNGTMEVDLGGFSPSDSSDDCPYPRIIHSRI
jgi:hypothetical protein